MRNNRQASRITLTDRLAGLGRGRRYRQLKDEDDAAFKHCIYRMAGLLVKKRLPTPFLRFAFYAFFAANLSSLLPPAPRPANGRHRQ